MSSIMMIAPFEDLAKAAQEACARLGESIPIEIGSMDEAVVLANLAVERGAEVIISRGTTAWKILQSGIQVPVIEIPVTGYDLLRAVLAAKKIGSRIGIADIPEVLQGIESLEAEFGLQIEKVPIHDLIDLEPAVNQLLNRGIDVLIGKFMHVKMAQHAQIQTVFLSSGWESVVQAIHEAKQVLQVRRVEISRTKQLQTILDFVKDGVIAVDQQGRITVCNPTVERLLKQPANQMIGMPIDHFLPGSRIKAVLDSGREELNRIEEINGNQIIVNRIPIRHGDSTIGVVSTFEELSHFQRQEQEIRKKLSHRGHVTKYQYQDIAGNSDSFLQTLEKAQKYARVDSTVLVTGETGSGKEVLAHLIHNFSPRASGPFVAVNCASIPESLLESELFGYVEGAFTGARKGGKTGLFELAHGGTLFLDEIGELAESLQARLLRVLQEGEVMRLGDERVIPINIRVIAATNRDLEDMVQEGTFRADLFYRLNVLQISLPSLRQRKDDIPVLCSRFLTELKPYVRKEITSFDPEAMQLLQSYEWPGNIRELRNVVERAMILSDQPVIGCETVLEAGGRDFRKFAKPEQVTNSNESFTISLGEPDDDSESNLSRKEREYIVKVLDQVGGNRSEAAKLLGIGRTTLWRKLNKK